MKVGSTREQVEQAVAQFSGEAFTTRTLMRMLPGRSRAVIDKNLSRLAASGQLKRIDRGLYARAVQHPILGPIYPGADAVANALSRDEAMGPIPSGSTALHAIGLSEQVPNRLVFYTSGASRQVTFNGQTVEMKHVSPSRLRVTNPKIGTVIEALRELGQKRVNRETLVRLHDALTSPERTLLVDSIPDAPVWMQAALRQIAGLV